MTLRAAVYFRQSLDRTGEALSVDRQREGCLKLCADRGWDVVAEFTDNDVSAYSTKKPRPQFNEMMDRVEKGEFDVIVARHMDRLLRRLAELESVLERCKPTGTAIITTADGVDTSNDGGRLVARILSSVAQGEVERKGARQKSAAKQQAKAGKGWGGRRAFGYEQGTNKIRRDEAKLIREAYAAILAGQSLYSIAVQWNTAGVTTTVGNRWSGSTVRQVLVNPRYAGKRSYHGEVVADATWKPIVSDDVWQPVVTILTDTSRRRERAPGRKYLLTGILLCGRCDDGTTMGSGVANSDGATIYVCKRCHRLSRRQQPVDDMVVRLAVGYMSRPDALDILVDSERHDIGELRERERALLDEIDALGVERAEGLLTGRQVKIATERLEGQLEEVWSKMLDAKRVRVFDGLEKAIAKGAVREWWDGLPLDRHRAILNTLMRVTLIPSGRGRPFNRDHLRLEWMTGDD